MPCIHDSVLDDLPELIEIDNIIQLEHIYINLEDKPGR